MSDEARIIMGQQTDRHAADPMDVRRSDPVPQPTPTRSARFAPVRQTRPAGPGIHLRDVKSVYLIGIGGVGMGGAARLLAARGIQILGSDRDQVRGMENMASLNLRVPVQVHAEAQTLPDDIDLVVFSAAVPEVHLQLQQARERNIPCWKYSQLVGALMEDRFAICVAGSHGKTTTSSLIASGLVSVDLDPSFVIGGTLRAFGSGARHGKGTSFVAESCEFDRSFHNYHPSVAVITNVDQDHLDYYEDLAEIQEAFRVFASRVPAGGKVIVNEAFAPLFLDDDRVCARIETFGFGDGALWQARNPQLCNGGWQTEFTLAHAGMDLGRVRIPLLGRYNVLNATAAAAALASADLSVKQIADGLEAFGGVGRRLELVADVGGVRILDDYGHHPAEIRAVIRALRRRYPERRLIVVFQPHQASRTRCLMTDFAAVLAEANEVWMPPIYFARDSEEERRRVTSEDLAAHVRNEGGSTRTLSDLDAVVEHALRHLNPRDVLVTMGAGNVDEVARGIAERL